MDPISDRQKLILKAIIDEYMTNADEIGSNLIVDKYNLGVSSATIRNEMVKLMDLGFLMKSHISSGRIPTDSALRLYIKELDVEDLLDPVEEVDIQQDVFRDRFDKEALIKAILEILSEASESASFVVTNGTVRFHGLSMLMKYRELKQIETFQRVLDLLENEELLTHLLSDYVPEDIGILIGAETGMNDMDSCAMAYAVMPFWGRDALYYGVIGSRRLDYSHIIPVMRKLRDAVKESLKGWR
jgi:heat-inducible transcriptional repressor